MAKAPCSVPRLLGMQEYAASLSVAQLDRLRADGFAVIPALVPECELRALRAEFSGAFLGPVRVGGATPWLQDIALWRDTDHEALSLWCAIDPATPDNGCLQVMPGSHRGPIVEHVSYGYDGGLHAAQCEVP